MIIRNLSNFSKIFCLCLFACRLCLWMIWICPCWSSLELSLLLSCSDSGWITGTGTTSRKPRPWSWLTSRLWPPWVPLAVAGTLSPLVSSDTSTWLPLTSLMMTPWSPSSGGSWTGTFLPGKSVDDTTSARFLDDSNSAKNKIRKNYNLYVQCCGVT